MDTFRLYTCAHIIPNRSTDPPAYTHNHPLSPPPAAGGLHHHHHHHRTNPTTAIIIIIIGIKQQRPPPTRGRRRSRRRRGRGRGQRRAGGAVCADSGVCGGGDGVGPLFVLGWWGRGRGWGDGGGGLGWDCWGREGEAGAAACDGGGWEGRPGVLPAPGAEPDGDAQGVEFGVFGGVSVVRCVGCMCVAGQGRTPPPRPVNHTFTETPARNAHTDTTTKMTHTHTNGKKNK